MPGATIRRSRQPRSNRRPGYNFNRSPTSIRTISASGRDEPVQQRDPCNAVRRHTARRTRPGLHRDAALAVARRGERRPFRASRGCGRRQRHSGRYPRENLQSVLHDARRRRGNRSRPVARRRHRPRTRRGRRRPLHTRRRRAFRRLSARRGRAPGPASRDDPGASRWRAGSAADRRRGRARPARGRRAGRSRLRTGRIFIERGRMGCVGR